MTLTVGIDIGTTSVKAVAVDDDGAIVARVRVPHALHVPAPDLFFHDADEAWRRGPREALARLDAGSYAAVSVAAMVPSLTAVDGRGHALTPGLLYGDRRGRGEARDVSTPEHGELFQFLTWTAQQAPDAAGFWPAQAMANHALCGEAVLDTTTAVTAHPLFDFTGWDEELLGRAGARVEQLPRLARTGRPAGHVGDAVLEPGTIDAFAMQLVAGADRPGDVLLLCGTTLITWVVCDREITAPGYVSVPHTTPGLWLFGGPSNAGGLFLDWLRRVLPEPAGAPVRPGRPTGLPVWIPHLRGERVPHHDPDLRGRLVDLDLTHGPAELRRAAFEATGFVVRRTIEASGVDARRLVVTGGGTLVPGWPEALADATELPTDLAADPEGGARGAAFLGRVAAGLEDSTADASRWAATGRRVDPDPEWVTPTRTRFERFVALDRSDPA